MNSNLHMSTPTEKSRIATKEGEFTFSQTITLMPDSVALVIDDILVDARFRNPEGISHSLSITSNKSILIVRNEKEIQLSDGLRDGIVTIPVILKRSCPTVMVADAYSFSVNSADRAIDSVKLTLKSANVPKIVQIGKDEFYEDFVKRFKAKESYPFVPSVLESS